MQIGLHRHVFNTTVTTGMGFACLWPVAMACTCLHILHALHVPASRPML